MNKQKLDQFTLDIEFLLISVVQAIALGALATAASKPLSDMNIQYFPYILSGFLLILTFWSQAIIHSLSFIKWPLDLTHNFLYFLLGLIEFLAFANLTDPLRWFIFQLVFVIAASFLYFADLKLIKSVKNEPPRTPLRFARGISSFTSLRSDGFANKLHPRIVIRGFSFERISLMTQKPKKSCMTIS